MERSKCFPFPTSNRLQQHHWFYFRDRILADFAISSPLCSTLASHQHWNSLTCRQPTAVMLGILVVKIFSHLWSIKVVVRRLDWHRNWWSCKIVVLSPGRCRAVRQNCWFQGVPCLICLLSFKFYGQWSWSEKNVHPNWKKYHGSDGLGCSKLFPDQSKWVELVSGCLGCGLQVELGIDLWN